MSACPGQPNNVIGQVKPHAWLSAVSSHIFNCSQRASTNTKQIQNFGQVISGQAKMKCDLFDMTSGKKS